MLCVPDAVRVPCAVIAGSIVPEAKYFSSGTVHLTAHDPQMSCFVR